MKNKYLLLFVAIVAISGTGTVELEAKKKEISLLLKSSMIKTIVKPEKMSAVERDYYELEKKSQLHKSENQGQQQSIKIDLQRITVSHGTVSADSNYITLWSIVSLGLIVDGKEMIWFDEGSFMVKAEVILLDHDQNVIWKKQSVWPVGHFGYMEVSRVGNNGNILVVRPPLITVFPENVYNVDSTVYEVMDRKGKVLFTRTVEKYKYTAAISIKGRYLKFVHNEAESYNIYDLAAGDSILIKATTDVGGTTESKELWPRKSIIDEF